MRPHVEVPEQGVCLPLPPSGSSELGAVNQTHSAARRRAGCWAVPTATMRRHRGLAEPSGGLSWVIKEGFLEETEP